MKIFHFIKQALIDLCEALYVAQEYIKGEYAGEDGDSAYSRIALHSREKRGYKIPVD